MAETTSSEKARTSSAHYSISDDKLAAVITLCPDIPAESVEDFVLGDWPEGTEHQEWLDSAEPSEIASWVQAGYEPDLDPRINRDL